MFILVPSFTFASFDNSLKYGNHGDNVSSLQDFLQDGGYYTGKIDGKFGLGTLKGVEAFQTANNLNVDGYFGTASRIVANKILSDDLSASNTTELQENGIVTTPSNIKGCTDTSLYSVTTGQPCNPTTQPILNLPDGCIALSGYSTTTGQKCDGTINQQLTDLNNQIQQLSSTLNSVVQNTSPSRSVEIPPPVITTPSPIQVKLDTPFAWCGNVPQTNYVIYVCDGMNVGDILTATMIGFDPITTTVTKDKISGKYSEFEFSVPQGDLQPSTDYTYTLKVERPSVNEYGEETRTFTTLSN